MTELRVYLPIEDLQPQFAAYLATPMRARGYPPFEGDNSLIVEVAPALAIHRIADLALQAEPELEPGILFTERQFGVLEIHARDKTKLEAAGKAILKGIGGTHRGQSELNFYLFTCFSCKIKMCFHFPAGSLREIIRFIKLPPESSVS